MHSHYLNPITCTPLYNHFNVIHIQILMSHLENRNKGGKRNSTDLPAADRTLVMCWPLNKNIVQFGIMDFQLHGLERKI